MKKEILKDRKNNPFKDRNNKLSSKRIITFISLGWAIILSIPCFFWGIGDKSIIFAFLGVVGGGGVAIGFENLFK